MEDYGPRDVTKTKSAQGRGPQTSKPDLKESVARDRTAPSSREGVKLAGEVNECTLISDETKARLVREIIAYEASHGGCTKTFSKKIRKQLRPAPAA